jgi:hypothetical protein
MPRLKAKSAPDAPAKRNTAEFKIACIENDGGKAPGKAELLKHLNGGKLCASAAIKANCYDCNGYYIEGKFDCKVITCPLYPFNPSSEARKRRAKKVTE